MAKGKSMVHKLDKETRNRHFPESNGGKGSKSRTSTPETREKFKSGYDAIDWSKK
jgi:hypothetical protein